MRYEQLMFHYGNNAVTTLQFSQGEVFPFSRFAGARRDALVSNYGA